MFSFSDVRLTRSNDLTEDRTFFPHCLQTGRVSGKLAIATVQPTNRMETKTKWFVTGLLWFALGSICMIGYFLTPAYESNNDNQDEYSGNYSFSDKHYAVPFGATLMSVGFVVALFNSCD